MTFHTDWQKSSTARAGGARRPGTHTGKIIAPTLFMLGTALALGTAVLLFGAGAQAQASPPAPVTATATATATAQGAASAAPAESKYTVAQIAQAFSFIDGNKDSKISREEAAGFRGVARHFDEADANKDGVLSRQEFKNALSSEKNR